MAFQVQNFYLLKSVGETFALIVFSVHLRVTGGDIPPLLIILRS